MVARAARTLDPAHGSLLMIENVGNLVCPAMFDLGERMKVAVISTTEGEDKPIKYPHMFRAVDLVVINKIDLADAVGSDLGVMARDAAKMRGDGPTVLAAVKKGDGLDEIEAGILSALHDRVGVHVDGAKYAGH